jgi:predicted transglutaminase-like cysteine proteinase
MHIFFVFSSFGMMGTNLLQRLMWMAVERKSHRLEIGWLVSCCLWVGGLLMAYAVPSMDALQASFTQRWGVGALPRFTAWKEQVTTSNVGTEAERLRRVNDFINRSITFGDDQTIWGQADYWATPIETLGRSAGDCEDYAIAKYFTLLGIGVPAEKLRLIYVKAKLGSGDSALVQAHMVLAYYAQPDAEPLVLDNLLADIRPASRRPDLVPVFSFNREGVFMGVSGKDSAVAGTGRLSRWEDLLKRARQEGFE